MSEKRIHMLDDSVAQKIAAGEVVERPASVIKELVENAIDAGSSALSVEIENGGQDYIRVADNGSGIHSDDVRLAFMRHATSKIESAEDLFNIHSMGFRGEALYSIAAVSRLELTTRTPDSELGTRLVMEGGQEAVFEPAGCPRGTSIVVRDLFFNTPARKKFMGHAGSESGHIGSTLSRLILSHPEVSMKFINNGKMVYHSPGDGKLMSAVLAIYGKDTAANIITVEQAEGRIPVSGFLGNSETFRGNRNGEVLFVNGRMIDSLPLARAVERAYAPLLMTRKFPFFILHIAVPPQELDVNVHPQKSVVRFSNEREVRQAVERAIAPALSSMVGLPRPMVLDRPDEEEAGALARALRDLTEKAPPAIGRHFEKDAGSRQERVGEGQRPLESREPQPALRQEPPQQAPPRQTPPTAAGHRQEPTNIRAALSELRESVREIAPEGEYNYRAVMDMRQAITREDMTLRDNPQEPLLAPPASEEGPDFRLAGVLFNTYVMVETGEQVLIIDQHAAHERLLYEQFMGAMAERQALSQHLLIPQIMELTHDEMTYVNEHRASFEELGFALEEYGRLSYQIRAVPMIMGQVSVKGFFREALDMLQDRLPAGEESYKDRILQLACKKAVKAGDVLDDKEIRAILVLLDREGIPLTCPHGRPLVMSLSRRELEKKFKRLV